MFGSTLALAAAAALVRFHYPDCPPDCPSCAIYAQGEISQWLAEARAQQERDRIGLYLTPMSMGQLGTLFALYPQLNPYSPQFDTTIDDMAKLMSVAQKRAYAAKHKGDA